MRFRGEVTANCRTSSYIAEVTAGMPDELLHGNDRRSAGRAYSRKQLQTCCGKLPYASSLGTARNEIQQLLVLRWPQICRMSLAGLAGKLPAKRASEVTAGFQANPYGKAAAIESLL